MTTWVEDTPGTAGAGVVVDVVPLLISWARLAKSVFMSSITLRLATLTTLVAKDGSSLCMASTAVRSSWNMPCLNFFGERWCRAACKDGAST